MARTRYYIWFVFVCLCLKHIVQPLFFSLIYLQNELDQWTDEPPPSPRLPFQQQQQSQPATPMMPSGFPVSSNLYGPANTRNVNFDNQPRNAVFSNALSSPIRRNLQHYHLAQGGHSINHVMRNNENNVSQSRDPNLPSSNDTSMDMHADSPDHDSHCWNWTCVRNLEISMCTQDNAWKVDERVKILVIRVNTI